MMTNGDPEGRIFLSYPHTNIGFFFLLTSTVLYLKISFQKSLNTQKYNSGGFRGGALGASAPPAESMVKIS